MSSSDHRDTDPDPLSASANDPEAESGPGYADTVADRRDASGGKAFDSELSQLQSCFHLVGRVEDQVRFADSKAAFLATIQTLLVGPLVYNLKLLRDALWLWNPWSRGILITLIAVYSLLFLASMALVALAVLPRFGRRGPGGSGGRVFFGQIARDHGHEPIRFVEELERMTGKDWIEELGVYVVDVSLIASEKHRMVRRAAWFTVASVVAWCAAVLALLGLSE